MFSATGLMAIMICLFGILVVKTRDNNYYVEDDRMTKENSIYYGYCKHCKEDVWCHWSYFDPEREHVHCNQCGQALDVPEEVLKELRDDE